jgi:hypothetical protein
MSNQATGTILTTSCHQQLGVSFFLEMSVWWVDTACWKHIALAL